MNPNNDHDLLIRVDQKVQTLIEEVQLMRDSTNNRLQAVEANKLDRTEFNDHKVSFRNEMNRMELDFNKVLIERSKENSDKFTMIEKIVEKNTTNINAIKWYIGIGIGMVLTLQFIIPLIFKTL